jgi:aspartyl/asparaginyl beta-hydroxylase (cupin superfamily)
MSQWGFYNIKDYVDFENLDLARVLYKEELDIFLHDYSIVQEIGMDLDDMYNTGVKDNWKTIPIINSEPGGIHFKENFPKTLAMIETCRGITNFAMNFTKPNGVIVPHQDPYDIIDGEEIKHYNCVAGVVIPSNDVNECGMRFDGQDKYLHEGEWFSFHPDVKHEAWNKTDKYRLTTIATIDRRYFK